MDSVKKLTWLNYFICLIGFVAEIVFAFKLDPHENSIFIFLIVWGTLPLITLLLFLLKTPRLLYSMSRSLIQTSAVVGFGIIYKINSIYIHPDPRGAIALATIPIIQIIGALFIGLVIKITTQKHYRAIASQEEQNES
ncbi:MAG: hypothetical protein PHY93_19250 [Bacteriovorax sp.]|nr:hypothetical protein [Bacteriovorax sp.]